MVLSCQLNHYQEGDGPSSYKATRSLDFTPSYRTLLGKRRPKWIATGTDDPDKAKAEFHRIMSELNDGHLNLDGTTALLKDVLSHWLKLRAASVDPTTASWYKHQVERHLIPDLGSRRLRDLTGYDLTVYYQEKSKNGSLVKLKNEKDKHGEEAEMPRGLSPTSIGYLHRILSMALGMAVAQGLVRRNVAKDAILPHAPKNEIEFWLPEESRKFLSVAHEYSPNYLYYAVMLGTGMRPGEAAALKWRDVWFEQQVIVVQRSLRKPKKGMADREKSPKTTTGWRRIDISDSLVELLRAHKIKQDKEKNAEYEDHGLVFAQPNGKHIHPDNIQKRDFQRMIKKAKVPRITLMGLRHTHATELLMAGVPVGVVSKRLGHSDEGFTLRQYGHVIPSKQREAADIVDDMFSKPRL